MLHGRAAAVASACAIVPRAVGLRRVPRRLRRRNTVPQAPESSATCASWATTICRRAAAYHPVINGKAAAGSPTSGTTAAGALNSLTGARTSQRHVHPRCDRSAQARATSPTFRAKKALAKPAARRWCASATEPSLPKGDQWQGLPAAHARHLGAGDLGCHHAGTPALVTTVVSGLKDTHKNWWECDTGIAYLVSGVKDWRIAPHDEGL